MRNFKKILSLVLAMAMMLSVMVVGAGAAFADQDDITPAYAEAVAVLDGTGVFEGYENGTFGPQRSITRAETAAIIYRVVTGDVNDDQVDVYADYNVFDDVKSSDWFAGYVNFCANAEFILGYGDGTFGPQDKVTGYQALAMILRAVGYDQKGEFAGPNWLVNTASVAKELGILENVVAGDSLGVAADRELVAELLFQAINVPTVTHTPAFGYRDWAGIPTNKNASLGYKAFGLTERADFDNWGRPADEWFDGRQGKDAIYATLPEAPVAAYTKAVTECDMAKDLGLKKDANYTATLNAKAEANGTITLTDTTTKIGAQGRLTEVYDNGNDTYSIVMVDQFLAKVGKVTEVKYDANGHITKQATMALTIYDETAGTPVTLKADENFAYAEDDMVLVYAKAYTNNPTTDVKDGEYEVGTEVAIASNVAMVEVIGLANSVDGKQTEITTKESHVVNGTEYMDAVQFNLDEAVNDTANYTWYFDTYGNLIGDVEIDTIYNYGTIKQIHWVDSHNGQPGYAKAIIKYIDGSEKEAVIAKINGATIDGVEGEANVNAIGPNTMYISSTIDHNDVDGDPSKDFVNVGLYRINENDDGELILDSTVNTKMTATIKNGVTSIGGGKYIDQNTMFLVWDAADKAYETYTDVRNVPTYNSCTAWVAETDGDNGLEYVFIIDPTAEVDDATVLYFTEKLSDYSYTLKNGNPDVYTLNGGYVNGADGSIKVKAAKWNAVYNALTAETLYLLKVEDGYVVSVEKAIGTSEEALTDANADLFAIKEGVLADTSIDGALLVATKGSYDVRDADVIGIDDWNDADGKNIWVVYDKNGSQKVATYIYVGEV